jgi:predicted esterase
MLQRNNGAMATWLRRALLGLVFVASTAAVPVDRPGRLSATPSDTSVALTAATGKIVAVGSRAFFYVPPGIQPGQRLPLLLMFPGTGGDGRDFVSAMQPAADRAHFAVLGFSPGSSNFQTVDNFFDDLERGKANAKVDWPEPRFGRDLEMVDGALQRVFATAPIDPRHIGLFGFSHGGSYALTLGTANPQLFSSIAALSPGILLINGNVTGGQAIFLTHGKSDTVQPYRRTACSFVPQLTKLGYRVEFHGFEGGHELTPETVASAVKHFLGERGAGESPDCPARK